MAEYKRQKNSLVMLAAVVALGLIAGYFYYSQALSESTLDIRPAAVEDNDNLSQFKSLKFNFSIFDDPRFKSLKIFGEVPVSPGPNGRADIFAPF